VILAATMLAAAGPVERVANKRCSSEREEVEEESAAKRARVLLAARRHGGRSLKRSGKVNVLAATIVCAA